jgi:hypothetical protein
LYLNIDPIPNKNLETKIKEMQNIAKSFFGNVILKAPNKPQFTSAQMWCWSQTTNKFIFNLQDDWILVEEVLVNELAAILEKNENLCQVALRGYDTNYSRYKGVLSPALCKGEYCRKIYKHFQIDRNPEMQLQNPRKLHWRRDDKMPKTMPYIVGYPEDSKHLIIKDIGREWILKQPFDRPPISKPNEFYKWIPRKK